MHQCTAFDLGRENIDLKENQGIIRILKYELGYLQLMRLKGKFILKLEKLTRTRGLCFQMKETNASVKISYSAIKK